jgi:catechol 2,3-dioxygenase-like lactoylglutathione lyase family enzyme
MTQVSVRYIVDDVDAAIAFYGERLGFEVDMHPAPGFAMLSRGALRLLLNSPGGPGGAAQPTPTGACPSRAAGTGSSSRSPTSTPRSSDCAKRAASASATRS